MNTVEMITQSPCIIKSDEKTWTRCKLTNLMADCYVVLVDGSELDINSSDATDLVNGDYPQLEEIGDYALDNMTEEFLNEIYGEISVCGYEYSAGNALKDLDPCAFRQAVQEYADNQVSDGFWVELHGQLYNKIG